MSESALAFQLSPLDAFSHITCVDAKKTVKRKKETSQFGYKNLTCDY